MKTKVVYVLVCSAEDSFYEQFLLSLQSLLEHNPDCRVEVVTDPAGYGYAAGKGDPLIARVSMKKVAVPDAGKGGFYVSRWLKTSLRRIVEGDFLYLDCDTVIARPLSEIDGFEGDIGAVINGNGQSRLVSKGDRYFLKRVGMPRLGEGPYYNGGVFMVRDTVPAHRFFDAWHSAWAATVEAGAPMYDQPSMFRTNLEQKIIRELPGEWNVQTLWDASVHYFKEAVIVHYYASSAYFPDNVIVPHIKDAGNRLDAYAMELARNPLGGGINVYRSGSYKGVFQKPYSELLYRLRRRPRLYLAACGLTDAVSKVFLPVFRLIGRASGNK